LLGISSKMFDTQSLVLLALVRFRERDGKGLQRCHDNLCHVGERHPDDSRVARFTRVVDTLQQMLSRNVAVVVARVRDMARELRDDDFDVEAACNLLALLAELSAAELDLEDVAGWIDTLALRFATTRGITELLARAAAAHPAHEQRVRDGHLRVTELAEQALSHSLAGDAAKAVRALMAHGQNTGNLKLIDTARLTLQRHRERIADAQELGAQIDALRARHAGAAAAPRLGQAQGRSSGGVVLRAGACGPAADSIRAAA
jgi:hypothetical protein